jgi:nicotinate (nicotinamide) nucleotide adenylyltransferase
MKPSKNIAILGGTFDPVTKAHIQIAKEVLEKKTDINEVWLMPTYKNPLKTNNFMFNRVKILNTLKLPSRIKINTFEIDSKNENGTYANLKALEKLYPEYGFSLIIGDDCALEIKKWKNYKKLLNEYGFIIIGRFIDLKCPSRQQDFDILEKIFNIWHEGSENDFIEMDNTISSTQVRNFLKSKSYSRKSFHFIFSNMCSLVPIETIGEILEQTIFRKTKSKE